MIFVCIFMHVDIKLKLFPIQNFQYLFNLLLFTTDISPILELMIKENRKERKERIINVKVYLRDITLNIHY